MPQTETILPVMITKSTFSQEKELSAEFARMPVLVAEDLIKIYRTGKTETQALRGVSLTVFEKEKLFLIGPSGSGKTTLVSIVGGLIKPTSGKVFWSDLSRDITRSPYDEIIRTRRTFAGIIFQDTKLIPHLSVQENVVLSGYYSGLPSNVIKQRCEFLLKFLDIWDKRKLRQNFLSGGEKKRAEIATVLISNPKILIADEPTGDLDIVTANNILDFFDQINKEFNVALLVVTHSQYVAKRADRLLEIQDGIILGHHSASVQLRQLEKSRLLEVDRQKRLKLPDDLYKKIGEPPHFQVSYRQNELILKPVFTRNAGSADTQKVITCSACGRFVGANERFCPYCDSPLTVKRDEYGTQENKEKQK